MSVGTRRRSPVAILVAWVLVVSGLLVITQPATPAQGAAFATGGTGEHRGDILWLTWGGGVNGTHGVTLGNGTTSTATVTVGDESLVVT